MNPVAKPGGHKKGTSAVLKPDVRVHIDSSTIKPAATFSVLEIRELTNSAYVIRFDRNAIEFKAGQHLTLGIPGDTQNREYSIYSSPDQPFLEVLIKEVKKGFVSKKLHRAEPGSLLQCEGPFGSFTIDEQKIRTHRFLFVATGTGIAPFHSMAAAYPEMDYQILHGVRFVSEAYERDAYPEDRYTLCTSGDDQGDFQGRVTEYLTLNPVNSETLIYLCGNCDMIYEAYDLLATSGIRADQIKTEVYF